MDLFSDIKKNPIQELDSWKDLFTEERLIEIKKILIKVSKLRQTKTIYPDQPDVLRIFRDLKPENVKVVILGQDPYYNGNANGYAFGCKKTISPSLKQIWKSIQLTDKTLIDDTATPTLEYLVKQGVMLLNIVLTVEKGKPNSHANIGWESMIREFLRNFSYAYPCSVYMLWGGYAKNYRKFINPINNLVLEAPHPVYAERNNFDWNCTHFSKANEFLLSKCRLPINWW